MKQEWKTYLRVGIAAFLVYLCIYYWDALAGLLALFADAARPIAFGCIAAYLVNILMTFYERVYFPKRQDAAILKSRRPVCLFAAILTLLVLVALIIGLIVPQLVACSELLLSQLSDSAEGLVTGFTVPPWAPQQLQTLWDNINWKDWAAKLLDFLSSGVGGVFGFVAGTVSSVVSTVATVFLSAIFALYLLSGKDKLTRQCRRLMDSYLPATLNKRVSHVLAVLNDCFHRYIVGQCTEAVILGGLCTCGMLLLRLPYATMIGTLVGFTALVPIVGAYIGALVGAFMILVISPIKAVIFLVFLIILQQLEGNLIYPHVVGSSIGLPGVWVLAAVTVGGGLLGIMGMLLGVPLAAAIYRLLREDLQRREKNGQPPQPPRKTRPSNLP